MFTSTTAQAGAPELPTLDVMVALPPSQSAVFATGDFGRVMYLDVTETANGDPHLEPVVGGAPPLGFTASVNLVFADGSVRFISESIHLKYGDATDLGGGVAGSVGVAPRLWSVDTLETGEMLELGLIDAPPQTFGALFLSAQSLPIAPDTGVFHAWPSNMIWSIDTDDAGETALTLGPVPTTLPAAAELASRPWSSTPRRRRAWPSRTP